MAAGISHEHLQSIRRAGKEALFYTRLLVAVFCLAGIAYLLWHYADQNAFASEAFNNLVAQTGQEAPLTPLKVADLSHQVCLLDSRISNIQSFLQSMSSTIASGGWCGNYTRVFISFSSAAGYPAHKLHIQSGGRSHTLAEVYYQGKWRVIDPFFNQAYLLPNGEMATFGDLLADPALVERPARQPIDDPALERIYASYQPVFPALYRDAADLHPGLGRSAFFHNTIVLISYPLAPFYEGERRPILPNWLDRPELVGTYGLSIILIVAIAPTAVRQARRRLRNWEQAQP